MGTHTTFLPSRVSGAEECETPSLSEDRQEFVEAPAGRNRASRGLMLGVALGAGVWVVILAAAGVIKL